MPSHLRPLGGLAAATILSAFSATAQEDTPKGRKHYKGREIAFTMHFRGAPWLVRESREREEECSTLLQALRIKPGDVVCDFGCGNGFYTIPIAARVGAEGRVLAVDIQRQMLSLLKLRAKGKPGADRIEPILGTLTDPKLPANGVDLVFLVDVYHELSHPETVLRAIRKSLKPGGRIVLAEFRSEDPKVPIKRLHKMSKRQMLREVVPNGFRLVEEFDGLPWQHLMFFERAEPDATTERAAAGLDAALRFAKTLSIRGGYAGIYSLDGKSRYGEALYEKAKPHEIWVQPPGTPSVGMAMLRAFRATGDDRFFGAARDAGRALAWGQRECGGWDHRADVAHLLPSSRLPPSHGKGPGTFDDDISQGALRYLIELRDVVREPWLENAIRRGVEFLVESQFDNGAWPQWYPLRGGYHDYYTFNDRAINDCITTALLAYERLGRKDCLRAAKRGGAFIALSQGAKPQAGWAQQYSHDMKPAKARAFEPAAICSAVTARNIRSLMDLAWRTNDAQFLAPIPNALEWLENSKLDSGRWARFYEAKSNRPIYGDRDGKVYYELAQISAERRRGYAWQGNWGRASLGFEFAAMQKRGLVEHRRQATSRKATNLARRGAAARKKIGAILAQFAKDGDRWVRDGHIHIHDLVRNMNILTDCLVFRER